MQTRPLLSRLQKEPQRLSTDYWIRQVCLRVVVSPEVAALLSEQVLWHWIEDDLVIIQCLMGDVYTNAVKIGTLFTRGDAQE